ncbi:hypothetical protein G3A_17520 [Bacillus sp. 17376]|nr:hypothetical protein [Mesobacillus boroniphilus]ESU31287.1 hypothetical protein G3A_17520 [Bacillus sp. 17376]
MSFETGQIIQAVGYFLGGVALLSVFVFWGKYEKGKKNSSK